MGLLRWFVRRLERMAMLADPPCPYGCLIQLEPRLVPAPPFTSKPWALICTVCGARGPRARTVRGAYAKARKWSKELKGPR